MSHVREIYNLELSNDFLSLVIVVTVSSKYLERIAEVDESVELRLALQSRLINL